MEDTLGTLIAQVSRLMRRDFDAKARTIGVTRPQWQVLAILGRMEGINQGALADILEVEPITVGRMIDRLQDAGLVERRADPSDRRAWRLYPTARGGTLVEKLRPMADETIAHALDGLDADQRSVLIAGLQHMRNNLSRRIAAS